MGTIQPTGECHDTCTGIGGSICTLILHVLDYRYYQNAFRDAYRQVLIGKWRENQLRLLLLQHLSYTHARTHARTHTHTHTPDLMQGYTPSQAFGSLPPSMRMLDEDIPVSPITANEVDASELWSLDREQVHQNCHSMRFLYLLALVAFTKRGDPMDFFLLPADCRHDSAVQARALQ